MGPELDSRLSIALERGLFRGDGNGTLTQLLSAPRTTEGRVSKHS